MHSPMDPYPHRRKINMGIVLATVLIVAVVAMIIGSTFVTKKISQSQQPSQDTTRAR